MHGFGFSFALRQTMQFAGAHLLASLLCFNIGVELGQLLVLLLLIPMLDALFRFVVAERMGTIILSALVAHTAWHWMIERADRLRAYRFEWPPLDPPACWPAPSAGWRWQRCSPPCSHWPGRFCASAPAAPCLRRTPRGRPPGTAFEPVAVPPPRCNAPRKCLMLS